jgi:hypothetical protein
MNFYKSWYAKFRLIDLVPRIHFSKNVQGWWFIRDWSFYWFTYCLSFTIVIQSDVNEDRNEAHERNVNLFLK